MSIFSGIMHAFTGHGSDSTTHSQTTRDPYAPTVAPINDYLGKISALYNGGAPQVSPLEQQGYDQLQGIAGGPQSENMSAALHENAATARGDYLTPDTNPYLADIARRIGAQALQSTNRQFASSGRSGSGLASYYAGKGVGDSLTDLYGSNYAAERGRQQGAVGMAPSLEASRYLGPQALISAGQNLSARPFDIAQQYGGILGNIAGLGGTSTSDSHTTGHAEDPGIIRNIANSFTNKLFGPGQ